MTRRTFYTGQAVVTRKGKNGTVVRNLDNGKVLVRFTSGEFEMRETQLVSGSAYEQIMRGKPVPGQGVR